MPQAPKSDLSNQPYPQNLTSSNSNLDRMNDKRKICVKRSITLPSVFHTQNSCFSMANQSIFGMDFACVGSSNGVLALVMLSDKSLVYAPERDPQTVHESLHLMLRRREQDAQQRHSMRPTPAEAAFDGAAMDNRPEPFEMKTPNVNEPASASPLPSFESVLLPHETMLDAPSTITCMRDGPLVFVGYMSGCIEWYQISILSNERKQQRELDGENQYEVVLSSHFPKHINHTDQNSHVSRTYYHGESDRVRMFIVARCRLPESGPLITSDYFSANGHLVVGSACTIAVFSSHQLESPVYRLAHAGCSLLYCHPCLPIIGTLAYGWNIAGAALRQGGPRDSEKARSPSPAALAFEAGRGGPTPCWNSSPPAARASGLPEGARPTLGGPPTQVLYNDPSGLNGGCLLRIFEFVELPSAPWAPPAHSPGGQPPAKQGLMTSSLIEGRSIGESNGKATLEGDDAVDPAAMPHSFAANKVTFALQLVQERLYPISSKQYGAYFCFSWKFSLDLELALSNIEEGVVYIVRLHRQYLPQEQEPPEKQALSHLGGDHTISDANTTREYLVPSLKYAFTSEHRVQLPLHSLLNIEYVSAATIPLCAMAKHASGGIPGQVKQELVLKALPHGKGAGPPIVSTTTVSVKHARPSRGTLAKPTDSRDATRRASGGLGYGNASDRFAALFRSQDHCSSGVGSRGGRSIRGGDVDPGSDTNQTEPFFLTRMMMDSISYLYGIRAHRGEWNDLYTSPHPRSSDISTYPLNLLLDANSCGIRRPTGIMSPNEKKLTNQLLGHPSPPAVPSTKGARSGNTDNAKRESLVSSLLTDCQQLNSTAGRAERPPNRYDFRMNSCSEGGRRAKDSTPFLHIGSGPISSLVGLNQAGEIMCIPIECEAAATWHEEGSVFASLGDTLCSLDIISLQDIEREILGRARAGFGLSAQDNAVVLREMLKAKKTPAVYRGVSMPPSTQSLAEAPDDGPMGQHTKDIEKLFTYVALLEQAGVVEPTGDIPSVLSLLELKEGLTGGLEEGVPQAAHGANFEGVDSRKRLLLRALDWLPSNAFHSNPSSKADATYPSRVFDSQAELEREVAVQVLHGRFEIGAMLLEFSHHKLSFSLSMRYGSMVSLLRYPAQTVGLIRGSNVTARNTFLTSLSPWLLAVFLHLCADSEEAKELRSYRVRIYVDTHLPLWDRVAMATLLESDYPQLLQALRRYMLPTCSLVQSLMLEDGISQGSFSKMQRIVDCTGDFQLGACLYARVGVRLIPPFSSLGRGEQGRAGEVLEVKGDAPHRSAEFTAFYPTPTSALTPTASALGAFSSVEEGPPSTSGFIPPSHFYASGLPPRAHHGGSPHSEASLTVMEAAGSALSGFPLQPTGSSAGPTPGGAGKDSCRGVREDTTSACGEPGDATGDAHPTSTDDDDEEENNWLWWAEAYRGFLDNEQFFVERTMFDVACMRLQEQYLTSSSLSRVEGSGWVRKGRGGAGAGAAQGPPGPPGVHGIPAPALPMLPNPPSLALSASLPLFPGAVHRATLHHLHSLATILGGGPGGGILSRTAVGGREGCPHRLFLPPPLRTVAVGVRNRGLLCGVCGRRVRLHRRDVGRALAWCTACAHGGHAHHLREWFAVHRVCPVEGCGCHCD